MSVVKVSIRVSSMDLFLENAFGIVVVRVDDDDGTDFVRGSLPYRRQGLGLCCQVTAFISEIK